MGLGICMIYVLYGYTKVKEGNVNYKPIVF